MIEGAVAVRRRTMQAVRSNDTEPERAVRRLVCQLGYRYRLHRKDLPGKPDLAFIGPPAEVYEEPATEFVARFIGAMNILEGQVLNGVVKIGSLEFPAPNISDHVHVQVGFRPYYVKVAEDPHRYRQPATLRHIYFLGVAYRLEIETGEGLILRSRMNKEEFRQYKLEVGQAVSFAVTHFRFLPQEGMSFPLSASSQLFGADPLTP